MKITIQGKNITLFRVVDKFELDYIVLNTEPPITLKFIIEIHQNTEKEKVYFPKVYQLDMFSISPLIFLKIASTSQQMKTL